MTLESSGPEFLIDECVNQFPTDLVSEKYIRCTKILPQGAPDEDVFAEAVKRNLIIITADRGLIMRSIACGRPVICELVNGDRQIIHSRLFQKKYFRKNLGHITKYILLNDGVVLP